MKTSSVYKKISRFQSVSDKDGNICFYSRADVKGHIVKIVDQGNGNCVALPIIEKDGEQKVLFHAKTIKSLVEHLEKGKGE